jgi:hypothetical protein
VRPAIADPSAMLLALSLLLVAGLLALAAIRSDHDGVRDAGIALGLLASLALLALGAVAVLPGA